MWRSVAQDGKTEQRQPGRLWGLELVREGRPKQRSEQREKNRRTCRISAKNRENEEKL
jgi:hypothetical protein